ncbi:MAG: glycosyltransferase [Ruminococcus sp.]|uniref:glycosyltransferase n=1 Tax=Ruminococcus sp. TaxID=41978 RepID=UPI0025F3880D|nr:glycosyltransferase [Ruminococcus sp.]MCR5540819.1 glycosyltransferase [Ruminococcus sp.]
MSKIAFISYGYPPDVSGGSVNIQLLTAKLIELGNEVYVITTKGSDYNVVQNNVFRCRYRENLKKINEKIRRITKNSRIQYFCVLIDSLIIRKVDKIIAEINPDTIVTVCYPFMNIIIGERIKKKYPNIKWYAYYLDPYFSNPQYSFSSTSYIAKKEKNKLKLADRVIMLKWMKKKYIEMNVVANSIIYDVNLPISYYKCVNSCRDDKKMNLVHIGTLYRNIRDPSSVLNCFADIVKGSELNYNLYLVGRNVGFSDDQIDNWKNAFNDKLSITGSVEPQNVRYYYDLADILISIGNNNSLQMPSKILQYIGTGKPIIHFYKVNNCPVKELLSGYSNALCVSETDMDSSKIKEFIIKKGKASPLSYNNIMQMYSEYDLNTIAKKFM